MKEKNKEEPENGNRLMICEHCGWGGEKNDLYSLAKDDHEIEYCPNCNKGGTTKPI